MKSTLVASHTSSHSDQSPEATLSGGDALSPELRTYFDGVVTTSRFCVWGGRHMEEEMSQIKHSFGDGPMVLPSDLLLSGMRRTL